MTYRKASMPYISERILAEFPSGPYRVDYNFKGRCGQPIRNLRPEDAERIARDLAKDEGYHGVRASLDTCG